MSRRPYCLSNTDELKPETSMDIRRKGYVEIFFKASWETGGCRQFNHAASLNPPSLVRRTQDTNDNKVYVTKTN